VPEDASASRETEGAEEARDAARDPAAGNLAERLFSLTGVVPLGAFLVVHVVANARALRGEEAFVSTVRTFGRIPALALVEALFVYLPLAVHALLGLRMIVARRPMSRPRPYPRGVFFAMRVTGVLVLAFLAMHLPELRFRTPGVRPGGPELLTALTSDLSSTSHGVPWRSVLYLAAGGCVAFHFAAGLWGYLASLPRSVWQGSDRRARGLRRGAAWAAGVLAALLWLALADVVVFHATGRVLIGRPDAAPASTEPCPTSER
jgi:succinate dehydrogenase / fumarate reductase cytochrome b subunit